MSKVITFSTKFPAYHLKKGEPTFFVEKLCKGFPGEYSGADFICMKEKPSADLFSLVALNFEELKTCDPKNHTIRAGERWKEGDWFSPRIWSEAPYKSKQITIAPDIQIEKVWEIKIYKTGVIRIRRGKKTTYTDYLGLTWQTIAKNDGLTPQELFSWFKMPCKFDGQIICWSKKIDY